MLLRCAFVTEVYSRGADFPVVIVGRLLEWVDGADPGIMPASLLEA